MSDVVTRTSSDDDERRPGAISRRTFLVAGGVAATSLAMMDVLQRVAGVEEVEAAVADVSGTVELSEASVIQLTMSPDRGTIVMNVLGMLWTLPAAGGKATRLTDLYADPAYPSWSPLGDEIAFQAYMGGTFHLWAMKPDGSGLRRLTSGGWDDREPAYSPDGRQIAFSSDRSGAYDVWILDVGTGALRQLTHAGAGESDYQPAWSPDGSRIAYVEATTAGQRIMAMDASGAGSPTVLYSHSPGTLHSPTWSPVGDRIAYMLHNPATAAGHHEEGGGFPRLMVSGEAVTEDEDVFIFPALWLSNDTLMYAADGKIRQRDLATGAVRNIPFSASVSFQRSSYPRRTYDFEDQAANAVKGVANPVLSPDGTTVAFVALNQLWTMRIGRQPVRVTHDVYYKSTPFWSPDGGFLGYSSDRDGPPALYVRNMRTGASASSRARSPARRCAAPGPPTAARSRSYRRSTERGTPPSTSPTSPAARSGSS